MRVLGYLQWLLLVVALLAVILTSTVGASANGPICPGSGVIPCTNPGVIRNYPMYLPLMFGGAQ